MELANFNDSREFSLSIAMISLSLIGWHLRYLVYYHHRWVLIYRIRQLKMKVPELKSSPLHTTLLKTSIQMGMRRMKGESLTIQKPLRFTNLADYELFIHHRYKDAEGNDHLCLEVGAVRRMKTFFDILKLSLDKISKSKASPWMENARGIHVLTNEARILWNCIRDAEEEAPEAACKGRRLNPWLRLGLHLAWKWGKRLRQYRTYDSGLDVRQEYARRAIAHVVYVIRRVCRSDRFRKWEYNDSRRERDNYASCARLMLDIFKQNARPLILRIDLYFEGDASVLSESDAAQRAYDKFLRNLSEGKILPDVLGYIAKREDGLERRIHYHVLIALDGNKHQHAFRMTEILGQYWSNRCVGSSHLGSYFNCWKRKNEYEHCCLGLLHYTDECMLRGLRDALGYMCKEGAHIFVNKDMGKNLRKSQSPKIADGEQRRGAPRKTGSDPSLATTILLKGAC